MAKNNVDKLLIMIEHIVIENYKSIRYLSLDLRPVNIFIGANGAGKSNFIDFFSLINRMFKRQLAAFTMESGGIDNLLHFGRQQSEYIKGFVESGNSRAYSFDIRPQQGDKGFIGEFGVFFNRNMADQSKSYGEWERQQWDIHEKELPVPPDYSDFFKIYHFNDTGKTSKMKQPCNIGDNGYLRENGQNLAAFLYYLQQKHPASFKRIEANIRSVAPFFDSFDLKPDRLYPEMIQLEWKGKDSDMYFNAYSLSDGTLRMIALAALLLQPQPPAVIIIDEPELGLHPFAVNKLSGMIRSVSDNIQVVVSTQSVGLVDNFGADEIIAVDRKDNQSVFKRLSETDLAGWLEDYSIGELWQKNMIGGQP